jgi:hypothetical protein
VVKRLLHARAVAIRRYHRLSEKELRDAAALYEAGCIGLGFALVICLRLRHY